MGVAGGAGGVGVGDGVGLGVGAGLAARATGAISTMSAMEAPAIRATERVRILFLFMVS